MISSTLSRVPVQPARLTAKARRASVVASFVTAALVSLTLVAGCSRDEHAVDSAAGESDVHAATSFAAVSFTANQVQHGGVKWEAVVASSAPATVELPGQLVPDEDRTARLGAPAQGRIITVHVSPGDRIALGQALVTLQSQEASAAKADLDKAVAALASSRAAATYARTARERAERLLAIKAASRQEAERTEADDEAAQAGLRQAEAEVERARTTTTQLGVTSASGAMVLRSPVSGVVLSRDAIPGTVAEAGAPLVTVSDPTNLWLLIAVPDRLAAGVRSGAPMRFSVPAFPADTFDARVQSVGGALDTATRTVPVRAIVRNTSGRLRAAMFATTWIEGGEHRPAVLVPSDAVQLLDNRPVVFLARPDGKGGANFERRDVETATTTGGMTQVVSGIAPGDTVVVAGAFSVKSVFARSTMVQE